MSPESPIRHVVLLMLENRSFDQMLGCLQALNPEVDGVDPAHPRSNNDKDGVSFWQKETDELQTRFDPRHDLESVAVQLKDGNSGFVLNFSQAYPNSTTEDRQEIMGYYGLGKLPALHALAQNFTICDRWFSSLPGPTWPNRFFALSGTSNGRVDMPQTTRQDLNPLWYIHQLQRTIFDLLNENGRRWKVYFYDFPNSWLLLHQLSPGNIINYHHIDKFFEEDVEDESTFPEFVLIEPKYFGQDQNDDHPTHNVMKGEKLIGDVYNAIRSNDELWNSTLLVIVFDEHGGFYDHVAPPPAIPPDDQQENYAFDQFGLRVPALLVSPWVGKRVEHTLFDHTSLLKYLIETWSLGPANALGNRTAAANSIAVALRESKLPDDIVPFIRVPYNKLIPSRPELEKQEPTEHQHAIHLFARYLEQKTGDSRYQEALGTPGTWTRLKRNLGQALIQAGNALTREYEQLQRQKVSRLTDLTYRLANRDVTVAFPEKPPGTKK
ncbi:MAG TPA: alkaline phosphatase family protein [Candidatus Angelobacter sp.]|jgi:phospholipase C|nr:alkaline phosphatase family protein [Candidatus Angelobacter sp.]